MSKAARVKSILTARPPRRPPIADDAWLSFGVTPLNMAVAGRADGGAAKGLFIWYVGDSGSGKTWFALQLMAEASVNRNFRDYSFYYDNAERGNWLSVAKYFGPKLAARIKPPPGANNIPEGHSAKIEEFYYHLHEAVRRGPCVYVLDSMDCLEGVEDENKFVEVMKSVNTAREGKVSGSYGTAVARANSKNIKRYLSMLDDNGSILIIINQVRSNIKTNPFSHAPDKKAGQGGYAMKFYASVELWTRIVGKLRRSVLGKQRSYGKLIAVDVRKNRITGDDDTSVTLTFLRKHGFDEVGSCVDYLLEEKYWKAVKKKKGKQELAVRGDDEEDKKAPKTFRAPEFNYVGDKEKLVRKIEAEGREHELAKLVEKVWLTIDDATVIKRKNRYGG